MIKPPPFTKGKKIGLVALAGPMDTQTVLAGERYLKSLGYDVLIAPSCFHRQGYLAGDGDEERALDLKMLFADDEIGAILNVRGGYGSNRILPHILDFNFAKYPKPFIGYSDITYVHLYLNQHHQLITYHGPMIRDLLKKDDTTTRHFINTAILGTHLTIQNITFINGETISGQLIGGNLTIICSTLGTDHQINTKGRILFLEEINEPPYAIDRLLMQLVYAGVINDCLGIILGDFGKDHQPEIINTVKGILAPLDIPIAMGVLAGHTSPNITLPLGEICTFDVDANEIIFHGVS